MVLTKVPRFAEIFTNVSDLVCFGRSFLSFGCLTLLVITASLQNIIKYYATD